MKKIIKFEESKPPSGFHEWKVILLSAFAFASFSISLAFGVAFEEVAFVGLSEDVFHMTILLLFEGHLFLSFELDEGIFAEILIDVIEFFLGKVLFKVQDDAKKGFIFS